MKILVTGAGGFVGKNLISELKNRGYSSDGEIYECRRETTESQLSEYTSKADFVYHLAGVNRPNDESEFMEGNYGFTSQLLSSLEQHGNKCPVLITSSIQAERDNAYGKSKKAGEDLMFEYGKRNGAKTLVYRLPNLFGKWSKPNYNTVVATYCYKVSRDMEIAVSDSEVELTLCYIDDVVDELIGALGGDETRVGAYCQVPVEHRVKLGKLAEMIRGFRKSREDLSVPDLSDEFTRKLYSTYTSFLPEDGFAYYLSSHRDSRGSFMEFIRTVSGGQVSVNVSKPKVTKGNHYHQTKHEKFLVVSGRGVIRFRNIHSHRVLEYQVSGGDGKVVDIPTGYTHSIENTGEGDLVTLMWASELFDARRPDTHEEAVCHEKA